MRTREEEREERRQSFGDAVYDAWRRGLDSDDVRREDVDDGWYRTEDRHDAAAYAVDQAAKRAHREREREPEEQQQEEPEEDK